MKKIVLALALMMATMTVAAENILYFTYDQAARTVACLNNQDELMIYCGYEDELPTYVLINEVWAEQISSSFYEIWLYGYDAYTGEEIYMPIDLECIYLMQNRNIYSAAQYLRFKYTHSRPTFVWAMPPYNPFVRAPRPVIYYYTYHYDIHRPGWHYRNYAHMHYHPYYRRLPSMPAPMPPKPFTPGQNRPGYQEDPNGGFHYTNQNLVGNITASRSQVKVQNDPTQRSGNRITSNRSDNTITTTDRATGSRNTTPAPSRTGEISDSRTSSTTNSRSGVSTDNGSSSRGSGTSSRTSSTQENGNSRSGVSAGNSSTNRGTGTSSRNASTKESGTSRSEVGTGNSSGSRGTGTSSRNASTKESGTSRSEVGTGNSSSSRGTGTSSRTTTTKEKNSTNRSNSTATQTSTSSRNAGTNTTSRTTSRSGSSTNSTSRGSNTRGTIN